MRIHFPGIENIVKQLLCEEKNFSYDTEFMGGQYEEVDFSMYILGFGLKTKLSAVAYIEFNSPAGNLFLEELKSVHKIGDVVLIDKIDLNYNIENVCYSVSISEGKISNILIYDMDEINLNNNSLQSNKLIPKIKEDGKTSEIIKSLLGNWEFYKKEAINDDNIRLLLKECYVITNNPPDFQFLNNGKCIETDHCRNRSSDYEKLYNITSVVGVYFIITIVFRGQKWKYLCSFDEDKLVMFGNSILLGLEKGFWRRVSEIRTVGEGKRRLTK